MESAESIVLKMNKMLESDSFNRKEFDILFDSLKKLHNKKFKLLDFKYYNESRLKRIKKEKLSCIKNQDFEAAAKLRDLEKECRSYISIRTEYKIEKSYFYLEQNYIYYFYLGTSRNDKKLQANFKKSK
jgi:hypothetical protein